MKLEIVNVEEVIANEIEQGLTQRDVAQTYALALKSSYRTDWKRVNRMIIDHWSASGLARIKRMAWSGVCFDPPPQGEAR